MLREGAAPTMFAFRLDHPPMANLLQRYLGSGDALGRLSEHAARLRRLQATLEATLPPAYAGACAVANLKGDTLVLIARNGATAARIKQLAPTLQRELAAAGTLVKRIDVRVRLGGAETERAAPQARRLPAAGRQSLADLAASLPADSPLRESLEHMIARSRDA